jgi:DNA-binding response OmpR family regulator
VDLPGKGGLSIAMFHVLLVEDNPADVLMVREAIRSAEFQADVVIANDGEQALTCLNEFNFKPDVILLDLNVPKFSGFQILERYRSPIPSPVVVFTSSVSPSQRKRAFDLGAWDYVVKPTELDAYQGAVRSLLKRWYGRAAERGV